MENIVNQLMKTLGPKGISTLSSQIGGSKKATKNALSMALPALVHAMGKNASSASGAESLASALDRDHDGNILTDVLAALTSPDEKSGSGIIGHIFGAKQKTVEKSIGKASGLSAGQTGKLLLTIAPVLMGLLGKKKQSGSLDISGLAGLLSSQNRNVSRRSKKKLSPLLSFIDQDGDGSISDELISIGSGLLGSLFKKR